MSDDDLLEGDSFSDCGGRLYFLHPDDAPRDQTDPELLRVHVALFTKLCSKHLHPLLVRAGTCLKMQGRDAALFVLPSFAGPVFEHLCRANCRIYGTLALYEFIESRNTVGLTTFDRPIFSFSLRGAVVCVAQLEAARRARIRDLVLWMGGTYSRDYVATVTHLIAESHDTESAKYKVARSAQTPVLLQDWLESTWKAVCAGSLDSFTTAEKTASFSVPLFAGVVASLSGIDLAERIQLQQLIEMHGGRCTPDLRRDTNTHLVTATNSGAKFRKAREWGNIVLVTPRWLTKSAQTKYRLSERHFNPDRPCTSTPRSDDDEPTSQRMIGEHQQRSQENPNGEQQQQREEPPTVHEPIRTPNVAASTSSARVLFDDGGGGGKTVRTTSLSATVLATSDTTARTEMVGEGDSLSDGDGQLYFLHPDDAPRDQTDPELLRVHVELFTKLCSKHLRPLLARADACLKVKERGVALFVLPSFAGPVFEHLRQVNCRIYGTLALYEFIENQSTEGLTTFDRPIFSFSLKGAVVCVTQLEAASRARIRDLVLWMGGTYSRDYVATVTHLIAESHDTENAKYKVARSAQTPVLLQDWLEAAWKAVCTGSLDSFTTVEKTAPFSVPLFAGVIASLSGIEPAERMQLQQLIEMHGGRCTPDLRRDTNTHLVTATNSGAKFRKAREWGNIVLVTPRWLTKSAQTKYRLSERHFNPERPCTSTPRPDDDEPASQKRGAGEQQKSQDRMPAVLEPINREEPSTTTHLPIRTPNAAAVAVLSSARAFFSGNGRTVKTKSLLTTALVTPGTIPKRMTSTPLTVAAAAMRNGTLQVVDPDCSPIVQAENAQHDGRDHEDGAPKPKRSQMIPLRLDDVEEVEVEEEDPTVVRRSSRTRSRLRHGRR